MFLDGELAKYDYATSGNVTRCLFDSQTAYTEAKSKGVGRETILKFLGGNWKGSMIRDALDGELAKYETWKDIHPDNVIRVIFC